MPKGSAGLFVLIMCHMVLLPVETSAQSGTAAVRVILQSPAAGSFQFTGTPSGSVAAGGTLSAPALAVGRYTTTQSAAPAQLVGVACDDEASDTPSVGDMATRSATFQIDAGETVTCTFTYAAPEPRESEDTNPGKDSAPSEGSNPFTSPDDGFDDFPAPDDLPPNAGTFRAPKAGPWNASNHLGEMVCTAFAAPLKPSQESGTMEVSDDGRTVVGTGFGGDTKPITMHAVPRIIGRYQGTVGSQDGIPMTIEFFWQLVTDEWIVGYLTSTVNQSGMTCNMFRTFELRYTGT